MRWDARRVSIGVGVILSCTPWLYSYAAGFAVRDGSADWTANVEAGDSAKAYDAGTAWTNPAGMAALNSNEIDASGVYIDPYSHFSGLDVAAAGMVSGSASRNGASAAWTGGAFGVWDFSADVKFGLAVTTPFGDTIKYPPNWVGRYQDQVTSIADSAALLSVSYRINDRLSIGGGPMVDYLHAKIGQAYNLGPIAAVTGDPQIGVNGGDAALGYDIGALWQVDDGLRLGVNYRSRVAHDISGNQTANVPVLLADFSPGGAAQLAGLNTRVATQITLPDSADLGGVWQVDDDLALLAEIEWTHWSLFHELAVAPVGGGLPGTAIPQNWRDTWFASVGANWRMLDVLTWQVGLAFDETPVPSAAYRYAMLPDTNRVIAGAGFAYKVVQDLDMLVGYNHIFALSAPVDSSAYPNSGVLVGTVRNADDTVSLGVRAKF